MKTVNARGDCSLPRKKTKHEALSNHGYIYFRDMFAWTKGWVLRNIFIFLKRMF